MQAVLQVVADHWVYVLPHYPSDIHQVKSPLLPEACLLHAKFKIMTTLFSRYLPYNCKTGRVQHVQQACTLHEAGAMLWREPFPKPPLSRVDPDWSIPTLFGALFRDDFSLSQSRHLWDWLLLWLFHYCYTHFFLPPENRHHPNSQVFTPKYPSPISDPPLCWCGERKCKDTDSLLALPCKGCSSGTELCSPRSPVLFLLSAWFFSPLWGEEEVEAEVWVFGLGWFFFGRCLKEIHHQHPDKN